MLSLSQEKPLTLLLSFFFPRCPWLSPSSDCFWTTDPLIQAVYRAVMFPVVFCPGEKKKAHIKFEPSAYWIYMLSRVGFLHLGRSRSWWMEFELCYRDILWLATRCGYWDDIFQLVYTKPAEPLRHVFTCLVAPETRGLKLMRTFFVVCFQWPENSNALECLFVFRALASAGLSTTITCQCYHSASFSSWLLWNNCKEWEQTITQPHTLTHPQHWSSI